MTGQKICFILGGIALLYGAAVLALLGPGAILHWLSVGLGALLILAGFLSPWIRSWDPILRRTLCVLLAIWLIDFLWFEARAITAAIKGARAREADCEWVLVLGAGLKPDGTPKQEYAVRLQRAEQLCTEQNSLILTGGRGSDEIISEAESGRNYLESRGKLQAARVLTETKSENTLENLQNALEIIRANGGSEQDRVLIVSSGYHLYRASRLAAKMGYENVECAGSTGLRVLLPQSYIQEYVSYFVARIRRIV